MLSRDAVNYRYLIYETVHRDRGRRQLAPGRTQVHNIPYYRHGLQTSAVGGGDRGGSTAGLLSRGQGTRPHVSRLARI